MIAFLENDIWFIFFKFRLQITFSYLTLIRVIRLVLLYHRTSHLGNLNIGEIIPFSRLSRPYYLTKAILILIVVSINPHIICTSQKKLIVFSPVLPQKLPQLSIPL